MPQLSGTSNKASYFDAAGTAFISQDPDILGARLSQQLYLQFNLDDTYRVTIGQRIPEDIS